MVELLTLMFTPFPVAGCFVVYPCQKVKLVEGYLLGLDTKLVVEFSLRRTPYATHGSVELCASLSRYAEWM